MRMTILKGFSKTPAGRCLLLAAILALTGCATARPGPEAPPFMEKWRQKAESTQSYSPVAKPRTAPRTSEKDRAEKRALHTGQKPLLPSSQSRKAPPGMEKAVEKPLPRDPVSLKMSNVPLATLLRSLAAAVGVNLMVNESVKGTANINITQAPWDEVFRGLMATHSLTYNWEGDILRVISKEDFEADLGLMEARLKKLTIEKQRQGEMSALAEQAKKNEPLETRIFHVNYTDPEKLQENLTAFLAATHLDIAMEEGSAAAGGQTGARPAAVSPARGTILVDPHTHSIIVQAPPSDMERIMPLIDALDRPTRQVRIEAHIVEARSTVARELGIQWGGLYHKDSGGDNYWIGPGQPQGGADTTTGVPQAIVNPWDPGYGVNFPADLAGGRGLAIGYMAEALGEYLLAAQLTALEEEGALNILSSPSITTLDNQKATIESGEEVPIQTVEDGEVNVEYKRAVLSLEVTPNIIDENLLKMNIVTAKDEVDTSRTVNGNPFIIVKKAMTNVVMFGGHTTVIGGLKKQNLLRGNQGAPWLKDIPFLGSLFKYTNKQDDMDEILIFITPHILEERSEPPALPAKGENGPPDGESGPGKTAERF